MCHVPIHENIEENAQSHHHDVMPKLRFSIRHWDLQQCCAQCSAQGWLWNQMHRRHIEGPCLVQACVINNTRAQIKPTICVIHTVIALNPHTQRLMWAGWQWMHSLHIWSWPWVQACTIRRHKRPRSNNTVMQSKEMSTHCPSVRAMKQVHIEDRSFLNLWSASTML